MECFFYFLVSYHEVNLLFISCIDQAFLTNDISGIFVLTNKFFQKLPKQQLEMTIILHTLASE